MNTTVEKPQLLLKHHLKQFKLPTWTCIGKVESFLIARQSA
jgi:hypothetical protein